MKFTTSRGALLEAFKLAKSVAPKGGVMPILGHALIRADGKRVTVSATDLVVAISTVLPLEPEKGAPGEGGVAVDARAAFDVVAKMPDGGISIERTDNNWVTIKAGKTKYKLVGTTEQDFPKLPTPPSAMPPINAQRLVELIDCTIAAVGRDITRSHLMGILLERTDKLLRATALDGYRLSQMETPEGGDKLTALIPEKGVRAIQQVLDKHPVARLAIGAAPTTKDHLFVAVGDTVVSTKIFIDTLFPPYAQVIPTTRAHSCTLTVDAATLRTALEQVSLMCSNEIGVTMALSFEECLLSATRIEAGDVSTKLDAVCFGKVTIEASSRYLLEAIAPIAGSVRLEFGDALDSIMITAVDAPGYVGIVMPMNRANR
jgi:DNA polymerase-3 subunit beta